MTMQTKPCECCGATIKKRDRNSLSQWIEQKFCSRECSNKSREKKPIEDRFWSFVEVSKNGCWEWSGSTDDKGYGQISTNKGEAPIKAHRLSWSIHFGEIPEHLHVCHACDNPRCVNPDHLLLGTQKANMVDAAKKGRINKRSMLNLRPGAQGFYGAGPLSNKEISNGIS